MNHKRKKSRLHMGIGSFDKKKIEGFGDNWKWYKQTPTSWNILHHHRPSRRRVKNLERLIIKGADPDNLVWPLYKKPHSYYW